MSQIPSRWYIVTSLLVRVSVALLTRSFFQPDEYFQSLEVAHRLVFGYGHLTWEWSASRPIRSILYPLLNAPVYWLLKASHLDNTNLLILGPRALHGIFAAFTDISLVRLTQRVAGVRYAPVAYILSLTSFFHALSLSRSLSNSLETSLTTIALSYFPWTPSPSWRADTRKFLWVAAFACAIRPTSAVIWMYMLLVLLWRLHYDVPSLLALIKDVSIVSAAATLGVWCLDTAYYGKPTFTPVNFLLTNMSPVSSFYGSNPWHYYLLQALPILCTTTLPFVLHGGWKIARSHSRGTPLWTIIGLVIWTLTVYSMGKHKEWRFIHPLLPLLHIFAAKSIVDRRRKSDHGGPSVRNLGRPAAFMILLALPAILYVVFFHSRAQIDVLYYLRSLPENEVKSVGFLMPCHSTPWQAYLHSPKWDDAGHFWALGCEPPLAKENVSEYKDQSSVFFGAPVTYLQTRFPPLVDPSFPPSRQPSSAPGATNQLHDWSHEWPQYIVLFGALLRKPGVQDMLHHNGYAIIWEEEYGWDGDENRQGGVKVWKYDSSPSP